MRSQIGWCLSVVLAIIIGPVSLALADYTITVTIGDTTLNPVINGPVPIKGNYTHAATGGTITIADWGGTAQVFLPNAGQDNVLDSIQLVNAKITATNTSVTNFPLSFQAQMTEGPRTPDSIVFYKLAVLGLFQTATGSSFLIGNYVKNPLTEVFTFLQAVQYTPGNILMSLNPAGISWPPPSHADLTGDRVLRVETAIALANTKFLDFKTTGVNPPRSILMYNSSSPDQCPPGSKKCHKSRGMYLPCSMKPSECKMKKE